MPPLTLEQVTQALDQLSQQTRKKYLTSGERAVLEALWLDQPYEEAAERSGHQVSYLDNIATSELRHFIADALAIDKRMVKRRTLRSLLEDQAETLLKHLPQRLTTEMQVSVPITTASGATVSGPHTFHDQPLVIGGEPPEIPVFVGRQDEVNELDQKVQRKNCVALIGPQGVGKSANAAKLLDRLASHPQPQYEVVVWKSIFYGPPLIELIAELNSLLAEFFQQQTQETDATAEAMAELLGYLRNFRILLVLDSVEAVLKGDLLSLHPYGPTYAEYGTFFRRMAESRLPSRLLLLSRRPMNDILRLATSGRSAYVVQLAGLDDAEAWQLLQYNQLQGEQHWDILIKLYRGNPQLLWDAARKSRQFFGGQVEVFLHYSISVDPRFLEAMDERIDPTGSSSEIDKWIIVYLAQRIQQGEDAVAFAELLGAIRNSEQELLNSMDTLMAAVDLLSQEGFIEKTTQGQELRLSLPPVMKQYVVLRSAALGIQDVRGPV